MAFIGMLSFQLSGALLLLLNVCIGSRKTIIKNCFPGTNVVTRDENNQCILPKKKLQESAHKIYLNAVAFFDLVVGYLLAALSPVSPYSGRCTAAITAAVTLALLAGGYFLSKGLSAVLYSKDMQLPYSELEGMGVDTVITDKEIKEMIEEAFKN